MGTETPATCARSSIAPSPGNARPSTSPSAMAAKIQSGRNRSSVDSPRMIDVGGLAALGPPGAFGEAGARCARRGAALAVVIRLSSALQKCLRSSARVGGT